MRITYRLFFALLGATVAVVLCMSLLLQWSMDRGFLRYVNTLDQTRLENLAAELERAYAEQGSWEFLRADPGSWLRRATGRDWPGEKSAGPRPTGGDTHRPPPRSSRLVILDADRQPLFGSGPEVGKAALRPLRVGGEVVGYLGIRKRERLTDIHELQFVQQQKLAMVVVAAVILLVSAGLSLPLANRLLRPVRSLAAATHSLTAGRYGTRVPVDSSDELGKLARDFNALALTLEKNEQTRRQWLADISHELRTPLAVLRGEIEAIEDGVRQPTPEAVRSLHAEVLHLGRLVDDLHQLALSDLGALTYRKEPVDIGGVLAGVVETFRPDAVRKGLALDVDLPRREAPVFADRERLRQLFANLLDNALKYTDAGGRVEVRLECGEREAVVNVLDSAPGVPEAALGKLFERFYRFESSRSRKTGGAGLGLAICRNIVEAHEGVLTARPSPLGGVWLEVRLPLMQERR
jgi:two-component system sensor histidine kinase BaeS